MILTCPECATSYFVDDARIPERGRTVKCAACGARWNARRESGSAPAAEIEAQASPVEDLAGFEPGAAPGAPQASPVADAPPTAARRTVSKPRRSAIAASVAALLLVMALLGAILGRGMIAAVWPPAARAYEALGLGNGSRLVIESLAAAPGFEAGRPVLSVSGEIRNLSGSGAEAPDLHVQLLDKTGTLVAAKTARPEERSIPGGTSRYFVVAFRDPPAQARSLRVDFGSGGKGVRAALPGVAQPEPPEAKPLPPEAPEALPEHG